MGLWLNPWRIAASLVLMFGVCGVALGSDAFERGYEAQISGNYTAARSAYRQAAEQGHSAAMVNLGNFLRGGLGGETDLREAASWYLRAARAGHPIGQMNLGSAYVTGTGVEPSRTEALRWFRRAAQQGEAMAQLNLGLLLADSTSESQIAEALLWFELAGRQGLQAAEEAVAELEQSVSSEQLYEARNRADGFRATPEAAWSPDDEGRMANGLDLFERGKQSEAYAVFAQAALEGSTEAQYELSQMLEHGIGVDSDPEMARYWLDLAARNGHRLAAAQMPGIAGGQPPPASLAASPQPVSDPATRSDAAPPDSPADRAPEPEAAMEGRIAAHLEAWSTAWSGQNVAAYLDAYGARFAPEGGLSRAEWEALRTRRVGDPDWIDVKLSDLRIEALPDSRWRARFLQRYRSDRYRSDRIKELVLGWEEDKLRILRERVLE